MSHISHVSSSTSCTDPKKAPIKQILSEAQAKMASDLAKCKQAMREKWDKEQEDGQAISSNES